ncbi:MAG: hypothetical protein ACRENC_19460, partial [Gemmatimonadaceae bacterium]
MTPVGAQQAPDASFHFTIAAPAFARGNGPRACIDFAHNNYQSAHRNPGAYSPLVHLLEQDGYRIRETQSVFSACTLHDCDILLLVDALGDPNVRTWWVIPHVSALGEDEIAAVDAWVRGGGGLRVIADHTPAPGAVAELGRRLGVLALDGFAHLGADSLAIDVFARERAELVDHAITRGRSDSEHIDSVATFTGHAFLASREWSPLLRFGRGAVGYVPFPDLANRRDWPHFDVGGCRPPRVPWAQDAWCGWVRFRSVPRYRG